MVREQMAQAVIVRAEIGGQRVEQLRMRGCTASLRAWLGRPADRTRRTARRCRSPSASPRTDSPWRARTADAAVSMRPSSSRGGTPGFGLLAGQDERRVAAGRRNAARESCWRPWCCSRDCGRRSGTRPTAACRSPNTSGSANGPETRRSGRNRSASCRLSQTLTFSRWPLPSWQEMQERLMPRNVLP